MSMRAEVVKASVVEVGSLFWTEVVVHETRGGLMPPSLRISPLFMRPQSDQGLSLDEEISTKISNEHGEDPHVTHCFTVERSYFVR